jgi:predicted MFS family arabinose efflux permease
VTGENEAATKPRLITPAFVALAAATLAFFIAGGLGLPIAPRFAKLALGADALGFGVAIGSFSVTSLLLRPIVGWSSDRFGRRPLLIGGSLITVAALAIHLVATDLVVFTAARCLLGAGEGFFFVAALAAASDIAPEERRGEAISFLSLSLYLGIAIGPPIGEALFAAGSYNSVWLAAAGVASIAVVLSLLVPESAPGVMAGRAGVAREPRGPLIHPAGIFPGVVILFGLWGMAGFLTYLPLYTPSVGMDGAGLPLTAYALIVVGLRIVGATWPDRFGAARLSGVALAISAIGLAIIGLVATPGGLLAGTVVFATGVAFIMPALLALSVSRVPPTERGSVVGTATVFLDVVFGTAPVVLGFVADATSYGATFLVSAALAVVAAALLLTRRDSLERPLPVATG